jgi:hypothetical protein
MPGTFAVDVAATFTSAMLVSSMPKEIFGTNGQQETAKDGTPKWTIEAAVTFTPTIPGMKPLSELITVTITDRTQPGQGLNPGTPIVFDGFRVGLNPAELKNERLRGGKLWYSAAGLRSLVAAQPRREHAA